MLRPKPPLRLRLARLAALLAAVYGLAMVVMSLFPGSEKLAGVPQDELDRIVQSFLEPFSGGIEENMTIKAERTHCALIQVISSKVYVDLSLLTERDRNLSW